MNDRSFARVALLRDARNAARARLTSRAPGDTHVAVANVALTSESLRIGELATLRELHAPPVVYAAGWLIDSRRVRHELVLDIPFDDEWGSTALDVSWTIFAALEVHESAVIVTPAASDHAWDTIDGAEISEPRIVGLLHGATRARSTELVRLSAAPCDWVAESFETIMAMRSNRRFHFALDCHHGSTVENDLRMGASKIWAGIECLIGASQELRFRVAALTAALVDPLGPERLATYRSIQKLYDIRSKVVHGSDLTESELNDHVHNARGVLSRLLRACVVLQRTPDRAELEGLLLGIPSA